MTVRLHFQYFKAKPDCPSYSLEKAIENREACIVAKMTLIDDEEYFAFIPSSFSTEFFVILASLIAVVTMSGLVALVAYRYFYDDASDINQREIDGI